MNDLNLIHQKGRRKEVIAHHLQPCTTFKIQTVPQGAINMPMGSTMGFIARYLGAMVNFQRIVFFYLITPSIQKVDNREKKKKQAGAELDKAHHSLS